MRCPTQRIWHGWVPSGFKLGEGRDPADLIPVYLRDKVALTEAERALLKAAVPDEFSHVSWNCHMARM